MRLSFPLIHETFEESLITPSMQLGIGDGHFGFGETSYVWGRVDCDDLPKILSIIKPNIKDD